MKYAHTNIIARDWEKLSAFYIEVFECKTVPPIRNQSGHWLEEGTGITNATLSGIHLALPGYGEDGPTLEIYTYKDFTETVKSQPNQLGFTHIAFEVEDVEKTLQRILENGGKRQGKVVTRVVEGKGEITFTYARDPEGNLIEIQNWK